MRHKLLYFSVRSRAPTDHPLPCRISEKKLAKSCREEGGSRASSSPFECRGRLFLFPTLHRLKRDFVCFYPLKLTKRPPTTSRIVPWSSFYPKPCILRMRFSLRQARPSLPSFPPEIHRHILSFVDVPTLLSSCRVSLAFLQLSSELLYQDIQIVGVERLKRFFCERVRPRFLCLRPFFLLFGRRPLSFQLTRPLMTALCQSSSSDRRRSLPTIKRFEFISTERFQPFIVPFSWDHPVEVDNLTVRVRASTSDVDDRDNELLAQGLFRLFDPTSLEYIASPPVQSPSAVDTYLTDLVLEEWTRFTRIRLVHTSIAWSGDPDSFVHQLGRRGGTITNGFPVVFDGRVISSVELSFRLDDLSKADDSGLPPGDIIPRWEVVVESDSDRTAVERVLQEEGRSIMGDAARLTIDRGMFSF